MCQCVNLTEPDMWSHGILMFQMEYLCVELTWIKVDITLCDIDESHPIR